MPGLLKVTMEGENFNSVSLITMVLSVLPEAPFVVVVAAAEVEPYFPPPPEEYKEYVGESYLVGPPLCPPLD